MEIVVHAADIGDREGAKLVLNKTTNKYPRLQLIWVDQGYISAELEKWAKKNHKIKLEVVKHPWDGVRYVWVLTGQEPPVIEKPKGFVVLPRRWVVERTFAWAGRYRRLSKDYEYLTNTSEAVFQGAMIHLLVRRIAKLSNLKPP